MKTSNPKLIFYPVLFLFLIHLCYQMTFSQTGPKVSDAEKYSRDSIRFLEYWDEFWAYYGTNQHDSAIIASQNAIELGKELMAIRYDSSLYEKYGKAYGNLGYAQLELGLYDESLYHSLQSYDTLKSKFGENHIRITEVLVSIAFYYLRRGDYTHALEYIYKSLHIMNNCLPKNHYYFANNYNNLANIYREKGDFDKALLFYDKAINHNKNSLRSLFHLLDAAEVYILNKDFKMAKESIEQCLSLNRQFEDELLITWGYFLFGQVYFEEGDYQKAEYNFNQFLKNISLINTREKTRHQIPVKGDAFFELAKVYQLSKNYELAIINCDSAINSWIAHYGKGYTNIVKAIHLQGRIFVDQNNFEKALSYYQLALQKAVPTFSIQDYYSNPVLEDLPSNLLVLEALFIKADAFQDLFNQKNQTRDLEAALSTYELAFGLIDKMRAEYFWENSKANLSENLLHQLEEAVNAALTLYNLTSEKQYLDLSYQFATKSKAILLAESIKDIQARLFTGIPASLLDKERLLKEDLSFYEKMIYEENLKENQDSVRLFNLHNILLEKKNAYNAFIHQLEQEFPGYSQQKNKEHSLSSAAVQNAIEPGTVLIEYFVGDSLLFIYGISKDTMICRQVAADAALLDRVKNLKSIFYDFDPRGKMTGNENFNNFAEHSHHLYQTLVAPVVDQLEAKSLIFIPDGMLNYIPFESLLTAPPGDKEKEEADYRNLDYLIREYSIRHEYSSRIVLQEKIKKRTDHLYLGFAPVYAGNELFSNLSTDSSTITELYPIASRNGLQPLKYNQTEVKNIGENFSGDYYLGEEAVEQIFKETAPLYKILHLAMHSLTNDAEPKYSQLVFSGQKDSTQDGSLQAYELANMQLNAELAVLSACNTGSGKLLEGEGVMSLSRAFKNAGCPNIVMSLWKANDASTKDIMVAFFENIKAGIGKADALRKAKLNFLDSTKEQQFTHPYYWATFVLIGDNEPIDFGKPWWVYVLIGVGGLILLFFVMRLFKRNADVTDAED